MAGTAIEIWLIFGLLTFLLGNGGCYLSTPRLTEVPPRGHVTKWFLTLKLGKFSFWDDILSGVFGTEPKTLRLVSYYELIFGHFWQNLEFWAVFAFLALFDNSSRSCHKMIFDSKTRQIFILGRYLEQGLRDRAQNIKVKVS